MLSPPEGDLVQRNQDVPGLAVLLDSDAFLDMLREEVPQLGVSSAKLEYIRFRPGASCVCAYEATSAAGNLPIYAKAFHLKSREKLRHWCAGTSPVPGAAPARATNDRWQLGITAYPDDRRLRELHRLHDQASRDKLLATVIPDYALAGDWTIETLRYKPERRYVASVCRDGEPAALIKMYDQRGFFAARARARVFTQAEHLRVPVLLGERLRAGLLAFEWIQGRHLSDTLFDPDLEFVRLTGTALAELHNHGGEWWLPVGPPPGGAVLAAAQAVESVSPWLAGRVQPLAASLARTLEENGRGARPIHGDFNVEQVVVDGHRAAILDYDRASVGHPAADIGSFAAYLERAVLCDRLSSSHAAQINDALIEGYARSASVPTPSAVRLHTAAALMRMAPEPFRCREDCWTDRTVAMLDRAAELCRMSSPVLPPRASGTH